LTSAKRTGPVLIAGGYGVVGRQLAALIRKRHPLLPLALAGRNPDEAGELGRTLDAAVVRLDVADDDPLARSGIDPAAVVGAVNDRDDHLLLSALARGIPYIDITRWSVLIRRAAIRASVASPSAPVMLWSAWMGGVAALLAAALAQQMGRTKTIDISILYALADRAGPDSGGSMDRLAVPFETSLDGQPTTVMPLSDGRGITFSGGARARVYRIDGPEQTTLPLLTGAATVSTRLGFDSRQSTLALVALRRLGLLRALQSPRLAGIRRALFDASGPGGPVRLRVDVAGNETTSTAHVCDPSGQAHLTALGALIAVERVLGVDGGAPEPVGVRFPEQHPDLHQALRVLEDGGAQLDFGAAGRVP
jgi:saccharopine dehydrogenase-like NADP-dependent oxidoreductase